jgi:hypothetical protein
MDRSNSDCYRAVRPFMGSSPQRRPAWFMRRGQTIEDEETEAHVALWRAIREGRAERLSTISLSAF